MCLHENLKNIESLLKTAFNSRKEGTNYIDEQLCYTLSLLSESELHEVFHYYYGKDHNEAFFYREYYPGPESEQYYSLANVTVSSALKKTLIFLISQKYSFNTDTLIYFHYCVDEKKTEDNGIICNYISTLPLNIQKNIFLHSYMKANMLREDGLRNFMFNNPDFQKIIPNIPLDSMDIHLLIRGKNYLLSTANKIVSHSEHFPNKAYLEKFISSQIKENLALYFCITENLALCDLLTTAISLNFDTNKYYEYCHSDLIKKEFDNCMQQAKASVEKFNLNNTISDFSNNKTHKRI